MKEKLEEDLERKEVEYIKGKIVVREVIEEMTGKKRRREDKYATYDSMVQEDRDINEKEVTITSRVLTKKRGGTSYYLACSPFLNLVVFCWMSLLTLFSFVENTNNLVHTVQESGSSFRAKGDTGGDVVRKGKPDPYAFI